MASKGASFLLLLAALSAVPAQEHAQDSYYRSSPISRLGGRTRRPSPGAENLRLNRGQRIKSPCPEVLSSIKISRNRGRWYGLLSVTSDEATTGVVIDILLDKRADLLGTTFGEVYTDDSIIHTIRDDKKRIEPGQRIPVRFFVKYSATAAEPPLVETIWFNGRQICPIEKVPPTIPTAIPPKNSGTKLNQQEMGHLINELQGMSSEYEIEWNGDTKRVAGKLPNVPEVYVINGEFKIKSNASLLILLIARPPSMGDHGVSGDGGIPIFGGGTPGEAPGSPGEEKSTEPPTEHLDDITTKAYDASKEVEAPTTPESTGIQVSSTQYHGGSGTDVEDEPLFILTPETPTASVDVQEELTTTTLPPPSPVPVTTVRVPTVTVRQPTEVGRNMEPTQWPSPCPDVFSYLAEDASSDTWFGQLTLTPKEDLFGIRLDIELDKPSRILGAFLGEVTSVDNVHYTIWNSSAEIEPGETVNVRIFVKYDREEVEPPRVRRIRLNGRRLCPTSKAVTTTTFPPHEDSSKENEPDLLTEKVNLNASTDSPAPQPDEAVPSANTDKTEGEEGTSVHPEEQNSYHSTSTAVNEQAETTEDSLGDRINLDTLDGPDEQPDKPADGQHLSEQPPIFSSDTTTTERGTPGKNEMECGLTEVEQPPMTSYEQHTERGQWPWHAAIYQIRGDDRYYICGGSLIGRRTILTAARCLSDGRRVDQESLVVYVGMYNLHRWGDGVQYKEVEEVHINPDYNSTNLNGNLAVLILSTPVELSTYVKPVCLWDGKEEDPTDIRGEEGVVVGWGYDKYGLLSEDLIISKMPVLYQRACLWNYPELFQYLSDGVYCAGYRSETTVCNGESGDGMFFPSMEHRAARGRGSSPAWAIHGVASFALSPSNGIECSARNYVVFTNVARYHNWIEKYR